MWAFSKIYSVARDGIYDGFKPFDPLQYDYIFGEHLDLNKYYKR
jgi:hypothetical protein